MAQQFVSARTATHAPHGSAQAAPAESDICKPGPLRLAQPRSQFKTRAYAQFLGALGWQLPALPRHEMEYHAPQQCCFVLRVGDSEQAAFGYTAVTMPDDAHCASLAKAKLHVERFLTSLGEDRGLLFQNSPLFAFAGRRRDRIAVFGGWRFQRGAWTPFLLGPDGLDGVTNQEVLFVRGTAPHHMAEVCGHDAQAVMPRIADLVRAIETPGQDDAARGVDGTYGAARGYVQNVPHAGGWFTARLGGLGAGNPHTLRRTKAVPVATAGQPCAAVPANDTLRAFEEDEFRFHEFGADRR